MPSRKGSPNKAKQALLAAIKARHPEFDPVLEMVDLYMDLTYDEDGKKRESAESLGHRKDLLKEISPYCHAKMKAMEVSGNNGEPLSIQIIKFADVPPEQLDT